MSKKINLQSIPVTTKLSKTETKEDELPRFNVLGYTGKPVDLTDYGIEEPVIYNTEGIRFKSKIPYLLNHWQLIGHCENIVIKNHQVHMTGVHSDPGEDSERVAKGITNGIPYEASMGLIPEETTYHEKGSVVVNGQTYNAPIIVVNKSELKEMTACLFGRDDETTITNSKIEDLKVLIKNSKNPAPVEPPAPVPAPAPAPSVTHNSKVTLGQSFTLLHKFPKYTEFISNSIDNGADFETIKNACEDKLKLEELDNYRSLPQSLRVGNAQENLFAARLAHTLSVPANTIAKNVGEEITDQATNATTLSLREILTTVANSNGGNFSGHSDVEQMCSFIKRKVNNMDWSTIDFPNLLNRISQWQLDAIWGINTPWSTGRLKEESRNNFLPAARIRPEGGSMWEGLDGDGKIKHGSFGEENFYKVYLKTIAQILTFKREDIINDDIGAIEEMQKWMIEGAIMYPDYNLVNVIYGGVGSGFLTPGTNLFNLPLTAENLETVFNSIRTQGIRKGDKIVRQFYDTKFTLVITPALERTAWEILEQQYFVGGPSRVGELNYNYKRFDYSIFHQLGNETYHENADPHAWGLIPNEQRYAPYSISYLNGNKRPTIEQVDMPGDMLGFGQRGYWDVNIQERESEVVAWSFPGSSSN